MRYIALGVACIGLLASSGCEDPTGGVIVSYRIGSGSQECSDPEVGISAIRARLVAAEQPETYEDTVPCSGSEGEIVFNNIPADVYEVIVEGIDGNEIVIFEDRLANVVVSENMVTETDLARLDPIDPRMYLVWRFANGFMCSQNNVEELEVVAYRQGVETDVIEVVSCDPGSFLIETGLMADSYDLRIRAIDATSGDYTFAFDQDEIELEAGRQEQVIVILEECDGECTSP